MEGAHDAPIAMALPLFILSIGSIFIGYCTRDMIIGVGTDFWGNALFHSSTKFNNVGSRIYSSLYQINSCRF